MQLSAPPTQPARLALALRSANKNVLVQINRCGRSSTFRCIFYEGHTVCCRCCCSDDGPAPRRQGKSSLAETSVSNKTSALDFQQTSHISGFAALASDLHRGKRPTRLESDHK